MRAAPVARLPARAGLGFKPQHLHELLSDDDPPAFVEVHAENYMGAGGAAHAWLDEIRQHMPLSLHGVGLSIGAEAPLDETHLDRLARLIERHRPQVFSEHLAWSTHDGRFLSDLLPLRYDLDTLDRVCRHVDRVQERLGLRMLLENPSTYFEFAASTIDEAEFVASVVQRTGCGLLLDVNNVYVSCHNASSPSRHRDPLAYIAALPLGAVGEIHLAGHAEERVDEHDLLLIDRHGAPVAAAVWALYAQVLRQTGPVPTLIEWDHDVPAYARLRAEARQADRALAAAGSTLTERAA
ncbi:MAG: DUF692 domain-containing protein [Proteobacteria bacterium]|nr:DUF692 domain-containing protein [Pseudomonadota bacterium]